MKTRKVKILWDEVSSISDNKSILDNISERLEKNLNLYISSLNSAVDYLETKKPKTLYKEINK